MILVNFKLYKESFGEGATKLAEICKRVGEKHKIEIVPVVSALDVYRIYKEVGIKSFLQHVDIFFEGPRTGFISPIQAMGLGARGVLINHSEHKMKPGTIKKLLKLWPKGLEAVLCLQTWGQAEGWARNLKPDFVAYEPKYLIGNKEKSVATEKPEMIKKLAELFGPIPLLAGAGVHSKNDVEIAVQMGAAGILVATDVVKAVDPEKELTELVTGFSV
jgi:triosephosphate isomerase